MKEQLVQKLLEYMQATEDFLLEHVPDIFREIVMYERIHALVMGIGMICGITVVTYFTRKFWKIFNECGLYEGEGYLVLVVLGYLAILTMSWGLFACINGFLRAIYVPKLVILKYLKV